MKIQGEAKFIERAKVPAPDDGVHKKSVKTGYLKGCHCVWLNDKLLPKGQTAIYYQSHTNPKKGYKVFINIDEGWVFKFKFVKKEFYNRRKLYKYNIVPRPYKIAPVNVDIRYRGKHWVRKVWAIKSDHVRYPQEAWERFAHGYPYDFNCFDQNEHPLHNPEGFKHFCGKVLKALHKTGVVIGEGKPSLKLGDIVYDIDKKQWFLVDCG